MAENRSLLEREMQRVELRPFTLEGFQRQRDRRDRNRRVRAGVVAALVMAAGAFSLLRALSSEQVPAIDPSHFLGKWITTDADGSTQTMVIAPSGARAVGIEVHDDAAAACSGASSTTLGIGGLEDSTKLVIPSPVLTCDDGSRPASRPPLEQMLRDLTFVLDPASETLQDNLGSIWGRGEASVPEPPQAEPVWPQTTMDEVRRAQELADGGDPRFTWQVDPRLRSGFAQPDEDTAIVARFLREELGWEDFRFAPIPEDGFGTGASYNNAFIRCAPGRSNPLYPNDGCAPTIDNTRYERVSIDLGQLVRQDRSGIWVVTRWSMLPPLEQVAPPTETETAALLDDFLQARIGGAGAEGYIDPARDDPSSDVPLLYATSAGAPYERSSFEVLEGPVWPDGSTLVRVRLVGDAGATAVEQRFVLDRDGTGRLRLRYDSATQDAAPTTENGHPVPVRYSVDGDVTFRAAWPWSATSGEPQGPTITTLTRDDVTRLAVVADARSITSGCQQGPAPADAAALARAIRDDADLEVTAPIATTIGGIDAVRMDVTSAPGASTCASWGRPLVVPGGLIDGETRMRLYLVDLPGASPRVLAIAITASKPDLERVIEHEAAPILDSFELDVR